MIGVFVIVIGAAFIAVPVLIYIDLALAAKRSKR